MTGSSASRQNTPIQINSLTSNTTQHGNMTLVNRPQGVLMAWEATANVDVAETARYMGVNNLQHNITTDTATGETNSIAVVEFTHDEYEAYRRSPQGRALELPAQPPEQQGNTIGKITFVPPPSSNRAEYANPPESLPPEVQGEQPIEALQALINEAEDERSLWQRTKDGASSAWDGTKRVAQASWENPGEFGKGVLKGVGNLPSDLANLVVEGVKNGVGSPLSLNNYAKFLDYQAMQAYEAGNITSANMFAQQANGIREFGQVGNIFDLNNDAQQGGSFASVLIPLGTLVKAGAGAAKITKTIKTLDSAADVNKAAHVGDAVKAPEPIGPNGNGGKIKATRMKQHKPKCFKPGKALKKRYKNDPKKMEKEFYKQLKAQEDGINKMTVGEYTANRKILKDLTAQHGHKKARAILTEGGKAQEAVRDKLSREINDSILDSLERKGIVGKKAQSIAAEKTQKQMDQLAALHDPDLIAGGYDAHTKDKFEISRIGNKNVNSSLGSQWAKDGRVDGIDKAAEKAKVETGLDTPMNVKLERCKE